MHKNATKGKQNTKQMVHKQAWSIKIIDTFETYQLPESINIETGLPAIKAYCCITVSESMPDVA
jgi:hypothetical protein